MKWVLAALLVLVSTVARADDPSLDQAVKQAAAAGKPLVIEFHASWCGPCKMFETQVLPDARVQKALETVMFVQYDIDKSPGTEAATKLGSIAVPTFLVVDGNGIERARHQGAPSVDDFVKFVVDAGVQTLNQTSVEQLLKTRPDDPAVHMEIARWFAQQRRSSQAIGQWQAVARDKTAPAALRAEAVKDAARQQRIDDWRHDLVAEQVAQIRADLQKVDRGVLSAALIDSPLPDREKRDLLKQVLDAQTDMDALNSLSYVALAAHANDLALAAATRVVAARRDAQRLDTLAECNHVMGLTKEALALEDEALGLAAGSSLEPLVRANRKRFETGTEPAPEVLVYADRARALWKQVDDADEVPATAPTTRSLTPPASYQQTMAATRAFLDSHAHARTAIIAACQAEHGKAAAVFARFDVTADGHVEKVMLLTEAIAPKALRSCIEKQLASTTLAPLPPRWPARQSLLFEFP
jgi:thiol-disulfide isomerase/thioredoxin